MTLRNLEIFQTVADMGNFRKAAEKLYITQSAVSHAVGDLENETGTKLFDRLGKRIQITRSGEKLLEEIAPILAACRSLESRLGHLESQASIKIVSSITIACFHLPDILKDFYESWPDITVITQVVSALAAVKELKEGNADLALIEGTMPVGPFESIILGSYHMKAVCSPEYLKEKKQLTPKELCRERLLFREPGSAVRDVTDSALYLAGLKAYPAWTSVNSSALIAAARAGLGITILPDMLVEEDLKKGSFIHVEIPGMDLKNNMIALWHREKHLSDPLKSFLSLAKLRF